MTPTMGSVYAKRAAMLAVVISIILVLVKAYGWFSTGSLSIFSSLADSLMDMVISGFNLLAIRYALKPPDDEHRFGHTAIEDVVGLIQAAFIVGIAVFILVEAAGRLLAPEAVTHTHGGMAVMVASIVLTTLLVLYQRYAVKKSGSLVVEADSLHYLTDILVNLSIIASLYIGARYGVTWMDPVLALLIAFFIAKSAYVIGLRAFNNLLDREMPDEEKEKILTFLNSAESIEGFHDLKTRQSGRKVFIQLHLELKKTLSFMQAHDVANRIEEELQAMFQDAEIIIHEDPV